MNDYGYRGRNRRARARRRHRRRILALLLVLALVIIALAWGLSRCGKPTQDETDPPVSDQDQQGTNDGQQTDEGQQTDDGQQSGEQPPVGDEPGVDKSQWNLILVNRWNPIPEDYTVDLVPLPNGLLVDARCYDDLMDMVDAAEAQGLTPVFCSAYRSYDTQVRLYNNNVDVYLQQGMSREEAEAAAAMETAIPGTSEHHLGLAVDIVDVEYQLLNEEQENTAVQKWLMDNSWRYGFILRYPTGKTEITGIIYEPWHYRYVGREYAKEIYESGLCFEEWLAQN